MPTAIHSQLTPAQRRRVLPAVQRLFPERADRKFVEEKLGGLVAVARCCARHEIEPVLLEVLNEVCVACRHQSSYGYGMRDARA